jgi:rhodanese-related sulfurtransferase/glutaredoxin
MSSTNNLKNNSFVKFLLGLGFLEWSIIVIIVFFSGIFTWASLRPKIPVEEIPVKAETKVRMYEFWGNGCPHCAAADPFLQKLDDEFVELERFKYEVYYNTENKDKNQKVADALGKPASGVPYIVVGDEVFEGYDDEYGVGKEIKDRVQYCIENSCPDKAGEVLGFAKIDNTSLSNSSSVSGYSNITVSQAKTLIEENKNNKNFVILDVRTPEEFNQDKIDTKAVNIDVDSANFDTKIANLDKDLDYLVYCRTGRRSKIAAEKMVILGFKNIKNLEGGTVAWYNSTLN